MRKRKKKKAGDNANNFKSQSRENGQKDNTVASSKSVSKVESVSSSPPAQADQKKKINTQKGKAKNNDDGGWSVVPSEKKKKKKSGKKSKSANLNSETNDYVQVLAKQVGIVIGPGGKNLQAIQTGTNTRINVPRNIQGTTTKIEIQGLGADIASAKRAINDLLNKGYCSFTIGDDFCEDSIMVHPQFFSEIIGKNGIIIRKIQDEVGAKLNLPRDTNANSSQRSRVMITGSKANVRQAKDVVYSIMQFYHHEITHPGVVHAELNVAEWQRQTLIGPKGSTIRHIQGNWSVGVHLPNENSLNSNTLVVGLPKNVEGAKKYILKILSDADEAQASVEQENAYADDADWGAGNDDGNGWGGEWLVICLHLHLMQARRYTPSTL
eukprot:g5577.t1